MLTQIRLDGQGEAASAGAAVPSGRGTQDFFRGARLKAGCSGVD